MGNLLSAFVSGNKREMKRSAARQKWWLYREELRTLEQCRGYNIFDDRDEVQDEAKWYNCRKQIRKAFGVDWDEELVRQEDEEDKASRARELEERLAPLSLEERATFLREQARLDEFQRLMEEALNHEEEEDDDNPEATIHEDYETGT